MAHKEDKSEIKSISDIIGEWGRWQSVIFVHVFLLWAASAINNMGYSFHAYDDFEFGCVDNEVLICQ